MFRSPAINARNNFIIDFENFVTRMHDTGRKMRTSAISADVDYGTKQVTVRYYDLTGGHSEAFFHHLDQDPVYTLRLTALRPGGVETDYVKDFIGAKIVSRRVTYDYAEGGPLVHEVIASFESSETDYTDNYEEA
jgi:hypothetical protein